MSIAELEPDVRSRPPILRLHPGVNGLLMSQEEFESVAEFDNRYRYELVHGVVIVSPAPSDAEVDPNGELETMLRNYRATHPQGKALDKTLFEREVKTKSGIRRVDRAIWAGVGRKISPKRDMPTIIVEFVSPGKRAALRDYEDKRDEYLELGAKEYWVIDRFRRTMTAYFQRPANSAQRIVTESETYTTPLLPGFELPLKRLLELADQYTDEEGA